MGGWRETVREEKMLETPKTVEKWWTRVMRDTLLGYIPIISSKWWLDSRQLTVLYSFAYLLGVNLMFHCTNDLSWEAWSLSSNYFEERNYFWQSSSVKAYSSGSTNIFQSQKLYLLYRFNQQNTVLVKCKRTVNTWVSIVQIIFTHNKMKTS